MVILKDSKVTIAEYKEYTNTVTDTYINRLNKFMRSLRVENSGDYLDHLLGDYPTFCPDFDLSPLTDELKEITATETLRKVQATLKVVHNVTDIPDDLGSIPKPLLRDILKRWINKSSTQSSKWDLDNDGLIDFNEIRVYGASHSGLLEFCDPVLFGEQTVDSALTLYGELRRQQKEAQRINAIPASIVSDTLARVNGSKQTKPDDFNPWSGVASKKSLDAIACSILYGMVKYEKLNSWVAQAVDIELLKDSACSLARSDDRVLRSSQLICVTHPSNVSRLVIRNPRRPFNPKSKIPMYNTKGVYMGDYKFDFQGVFKQYLSYESLPYEKVS